MSWQDIKTLLQKVHTSFGEQVLSRKAVAEVLSQVLGISIDEKSVSIRRSVVHLTAHPAVKNEVLLQKTRVLSALHDRGIAISDVR